MRHDAYHHPDLRSALIAEATDIVRETGHQALTLRAVSRRADVSTAALYRHFANMKSLLASVAAVGYRELRERIANGAGEAGPANAPMVHLRAVADRYVEFAMRSPRLLEVMLLPDVLRYEGGELPQEMQATYDVFVDAVRACQQSGDLRQGDTLELAYTMYVPVHGVVALSIGGAPPPYVGQIDLDRSLDLVWHSLVHGLAPPKV